MVFPLSAFLVILTIVKNQNPMRPPYCLFLLLVSIAMGGCQPKDYTTAARYEQGLVVCLGGAGGMAGEVDRLREGLYEAGVVYALEDFHWSRNDVLNDQMDLEENRRRASQLARRIEGYYYAHPDRPVYLIGVSAGTGIVVWSLEDLQPSHSIQAAFLIASSLDSRYDLTKALECVNGQMYIFYCYTDPLLSLGTTLAGTVDRRHTLSGGLGGFSPPEKADQYTKELYNSKFTQRGWQPTDIFEGHIGDHLGATNPAFVRKHIAPLIRE